jgi:HEAT repeat protein
LEEYDFPVIITAEWGQADRLAKLLEAGNTNHFRKLKIVSIMGEMVNDTTLPPQALATLKNALKDKDLAKQAAVALGNLSPESIPMLIDMLRTAKEPELQAAAAKGLGQIGALNGDARIVPPLIEVLQAPNIDYAVLTEVAWALGKVPDRRAADPLYALDKKLRLNPDSRGDPKIKKLLEAVFWAIKQIDTWDQYS